MANKIDKFQGLESLPVSTAILDATGRIVAVNEAWKTFGQRNGLCLPDFGIGADYFSYCPPGVGETGRLAMQLKDLLAGRSEMVTTIYPCHSPMRQRWFFLIGMPLSVERPNGIAILHAELTGLLPTSAASSTPGGEERTTTVAGVIERSVAETLATQLRTMIEAPPSDREAAGADPMTKLSRRQLEVLRLLGEGKTNAEIAEALFRSPYTIKLHVSAILRQLNLKSRTQAALVASRLWPAKGGRSD